MANDNDSSADVGAILQALRAEVRARRVAAGGGNEQGSALDRQLARSAEQLEITRVVSAHWPLEGTTLLQRALFLVHKLVRRGLRWYINPIVEQQNAFNDVAAHALRLLIEAYKELDSHAQEAHRRDEKGLGGSGRGTLPDPPFFTSRITHHSLQEMVVARGAAEPPAALADLALLDLPRALAEQPPVSAHWQLAGAGAPLQRLVRRYLRWLINPIVEQQNAYNAALAELFTLAVAADAEARARLAQQKGRARGGTPSPKTAPLF